MQSARIKLQTSLLLCCHLSYRGMCFKYPSKPGHSHHSHLQLNLPLPSVVGKSAGTCYTWITLPPHCCELCRLFLAHLHESILANEVTQPSHPYKLRQADPTHNKYCNKSGHSCAQIHMWYAICTIQICNGDMCTHPRTYIVTG